MFAPPTTPCPLPVCPLLRPQAPGPSPLVALPRLAHPQCGSSSFSLHIARHAHPLADRGMRNVASSLRHGFRHDRDSHSVRVNPPPQKKSLTLDTPMPVCTRQCLYVHPERGPLSRTRTTTQRAAWQRKSWRRQMSIPLKTQARKGVVCAHTLSPSICHREICPHPGPSQIHLPEHVFQSWSGTGCRGHRAVKTDWRRNAMPPRDPPRLNPQCHPQTPKHSWE